MADKNCSICGGKGYYCEFSTVETCWCVEPTPVAYEISDLKAEVAKLKRLIAERWKPEVERLRARLEIDARTPYDGIACRDETIKGLDEKCDRLKAENEALRSALLEVRDAFSNADAKCFAATIGAIDAALEGGGR